MIGSIHGQDHDQIASEHSAFCDRVEDAAMALQDLSYQLGLERGRKEANKELLQALQAYERWADKTICRDPELAAIRAQMRAAIARATGSEA
jgi:hypothetical protein